MTQTEGMSEPIIAADGAARANADLVLAFFAEVLGGSRDAGAVDRFVGDDFVDHDPAGDDTGRDGVAAKLTGLWAALPDGAYEPHLVVASRDLVAVHSVLRTGAGEAAFADVYRVAGGAIREHWHVVDTAALGALLGGRGA